MNYLDSLVFLLVLVQGGLLPEREFLQVLNILLLVLVGILVSKRDVLGRQVGPRHLR